MKTTRLSRCIRRRLPIGNWFVTIGPAGLTFRQKRRKEAYFLPWEDALGRAQANLADAMWQSRLPLGELKQTPMFGGEAPVPDHGQAHPYWRPALRPDLSSCGRDDISDGLE